MDGTTWCSVGRGRCRAAGLELGSWGLGAGAVPETGGRGVRRAPQPGASYSARISLSFWTRSEAAGPSRATAAGYPGS